MNAHVHAGAHRRQRRRLGEDLRVRADAHFQVLGPQPLRRQHLLDAKRLRRAGAHGGEPCVGQVRHALADRFGLGGIAARLLLDDALDHAGGKSHAGGFHHLQVVRREQVAVTRIGAVLAGGCQPVRHRAECGASSLPDRIRRVRQVEQGGNGRAQRAQVEQLAVAHDDRRRPALRPRQPRAANQHRPRGVTWQGFLDGDAARHVRPSPGRL